MDFYADCAKSTNSELHFHPYAIYMGCILVFLGYPKVRSYWVILSKKRESVGNMWVFCFSRAVCLWVQILFKITTFFRQDYCGHFGGYIVIFRLIERLLTPIAFWPHEQNFVCFPVISFVGFSLKKKVEISTAFKIFLDFGLYDSFLKCLRNKTIGPQNAAHPWKWRCRSGTWGTPGKKVFAPIRHTVYCNLWNFQNHKYRSVNERQRKNILEMAIKSDNMCRTQISMFQIVWNHK